MVEVIEDKEGIRRKVNEGYMGTDREKKWR